MDLQNSWEGILTKCLTDLKNVYPRFNDAQLADKVKIPRATFNRIKNERKLPRLDNLIKLILGSGNNSLLSEAVSIVDQDLGTSLQDVLNVALKENNKRIANAELESLLEDRDTFVAYLLADMPNGTSKLQLVEVLGNSGIESMKILVNKGIAFEENKKFFIKDSGILIRSFESIKYHISTYAKHYKTEHVGKERNYVFSLSGGLNNVGQKRVQAAYRRLHEELQTIYRDDINAGDIPSFSVGFCDTFTAIDSLINKPHGEELQ